MIEKQIYVLRDPRDGAVRYVGATGCTLLGRLYRHVYSRIYDCRRSRWIAELYDEGLRPLIEQVAEPTLDWEAAEAHWIKHYTDLGCDLVNGTRGGLGFTGAHSAETKQRIVAAKKGRSISFRNPSERGRKISEKLTGRPKSDETKEKLRKANLGHEKISERTKGEVLRLFAGGMPRRTIATELRMGRHTVGRIIALDAASRGETINPHEKLASSRLLMSQVRMRK